MKQLITISLLLLFYQNLFAAKSHFFESFIGISKEEVEVVIDEFNYEFKFIETNDTCVTLIQFSQSNNEDQMKFELYFKDDIVNSYNLYVTCSLCFIEYCELLHVTKKWLKYPESNFYDKKKEIHLKIEDISNDINWCKKLTFSSKKEPKVEISKGKKLNLTAYSLMDTNIRVITQETFLETQLTRRDSIISEWLFLELSNSDCVSISKYYLVYDRDTKKLVKSSTYDSRGITTESRIYNRKTGKIKYKIEYNLENSAIKLHNRSNSLIIDKKANYTETYYHKDGKVDWINKKVSK